MRRWLLFAFALFIVLTMSYGIVEIEAADGDESSESITSFSETLDDDTLFYPDAFLDDTIETADAGKVEGGTATNTYTATQSKDGTDYKVLNATATATPYEYYLYLNFTMPSNAEGFDLNLYCQGGVGSGTIYNNDIEYYDGSSWVDIDDFTTGGSDDWANSTEHWTSEDTAMIRLYLNCTVDATEFAFIYVDYAEVKFWEMTLADSGHYAESFADESDWALTNTEGDASLSTDGDIVSFEANGDSTNDFDIIRSNTPSVSDWDYIELRWKFNTTWSKAPHIYISTSDDMGGTTAYKNQPESTSWDTVKLHKEDFTSSIDTIECIDLRFKYDSGDKVKMEVDYLRIASADELGFQHDGSTTEGVTDGGGGSSSSDGDELTLTADADGSTFEFVIDTTATAAYLDAGHYPFISLDFNDADSADYVKVESYDGSAWATVIANTTVGTEPLYGNVKAVDDEVEKFRISVNPSANPRMDFTKSYSIANWTISHTYTEIDDYCYVNSGILYFSFGTTYDVFIFNHDPALSVTAATYNVWNLTMSDVNPTTSDDVVFHANLGSGLVEQGTDESRGSWTSGTTVSDIRFYFKSQSTTAQTYTLSAIKFIEDGTAPSTRIMVSPTNPYDDEVVTLTAIAIDTVEVYKVWFNALQFPSSFSDIDYEANEGEGDSWTYSFSTLTAGNYTFKVIANDGANNSTVTADNMASTVVSFVVRQRILEVDGWRINVASSEVSGGGYINKDADVSIYEDPEKDGSYSLTATTSVTKGTFSFYWTRYSATSSGDVRYAVKFYTATETWWENGTYSRAIAEAFAVEEWWFDLELGKEPYIEFYGRTSWENSTIKVYDNDTLQITVTEEEGGAYSFFWLDLTKGNHVIEMNFTHSGQTTICKNRTYYVPDWSATGLQFRWDVETFQDNITLIELESNWGNCTFYIYLNNTLKATSALDPTTVNITRGSNDGVWNLTLKADGGTQAKTISNIRYKVTEEGTTTITNLAGSHESITMVADEPFMIRDWRIYSTSSYACMSGHSNERSLYTVYENGIVVKTGEVYKDFLITWTKQDWVTVNVTVIFESRDSPEDYICNGVYGEEAGSAVIFETVVGLVVLMFLGIFAGGMIIWWQERKEKRRDFRAAQAGR